MLEGRGWIKALVSAGSTINHRNLNPGFFNLDTSGTPPAPVQACNSAILFFLIGIESYIFKI